MRLPSFSRSTRLPSLAIALFTPFLTIACDDEGARLGTVNALAKGGYARLQFSDGCQGGAKLPSPCSSDRLEEVLSVSVDNFTIVEVVNGEDLSEFAGAADTWMTYGLAAGTAVSTLDGRFDDGTVRTASVKVTVGEIDKVAVIADCSDAAAVLIDRPLAFDVKILDADGGKLGGHVSDLVEGNDFIWTYISGRGSLSSRALLPSFSILSSAHDPSLQLKASSHDPAEITEYTFPAQPDSWAERGKGSRVKIHPGIEETPLCSFESEGDDDSRFALPSAMDVWLQGSVGLGELIELKASGKVRKRDETKAGVGTKRVKAGGFNIHAGVTAQTKD